MTGERVNGRIVALCGGVGGAKLALGLSLLVDPEQLSIIVNVGDDFEHLGLCVSPDIDTVVYTLAGLVNPETGWGRRDESWRFMEMLGRLGGDTWFNLGDTDLAMHAWRTERLSRGTRLTEVTRDVARKLGIDAAILPVSDDPVRTMVDTDEGELPFQRYFVGRQCQPRARSLRYDNAEAARLTPEVIAALDDPELAMVVICPSNPYLSIDPMLAIPGLRERLEARRVPVIAVSPIIGGASVKGPLSKMMAEFGITSDVASVASHYDDLIDVLVVDEADREAVIEGPRMVVTKTLMTTLADRVALAGFVVRTAQQGRPSDE
ncbi:MAG: 2-phospho-L-lactate transferase [Roseovarius sp.]